MVKDIKIQDNFWTEYINLIKDVAIPYQWEALNDRIPDAEPSYSIKNYRIAAGLEEGEFHGYVFQDSDLSKWIEAVAYILEAYPNAELENTADGVIDLMEKAQQQDGYLDTRFIVKETEKRWIDERDNHELYCAGHLIEAAVAYYESTGKKNLLNIAYKFADYIDTVFGKEEGKKHGYPGHQILEMALLRLYRVSKNEKYLKLSKYFIDERGKEPNYFTLESQAREKIIGKEALEREPYNRLLKDSYEYDQSHLPVRKQTKAVGHAVRAMYMYTAMADLAGETADESLVQTCKTLWDNVTECQMYVTGGLGSNAFNEGFSFDYDLPSDRAYAETCASVGLIFFANKMLSLDPDSKYADVMERVLYNGTISGMSLDGKRFFYVNPLEVNPIACEKREDIDVAPVRQKWFGCACCPPNLARLIASVGKYIYSQINDKIYVHLYIGSTTNFNVNGKNVEISQEGNYPWYGDINMKVDTEAPCEFTVAVRIPDWCRDAKIKVNGEIVNITSVINKGYAEIKRVWKKNDQIEINLSMQVEKIQANPNVRDNAWKVALQRGPIVYCLEEVDNGPNLQNICLNKDDFNVHFDKDLLGGVMVITGKGIRNDIAGWDGKLYRKFEYNTKPVEIKAVPYYAWQNRTPGEMLVWIRQK